MFNVFLPKLLERRLGGMTPESPQPGVRSIAQIQSAESSLEDSLWDVVIYSIGGCPGAIVSVMMGSSLRTRLNEPPLHEARCLSD